MNDVIIVDYNAFSLESRVSIVKDGRHEHVNIASDMETLTQSLLGLTYANNIYNVRVRAPFSMVNEIRAQVGEAESSTYSENKINVEGI